MSTTEKTEQREYCEGDTCPKCRNRKLSILQADGDSTDENRKKDTLWCQRCVKCFQIDHARLFRRRIAEHIAAMLFTNGIGEHAVRLVLELADKKDGGGWCLIAVIDRIAKVLDEFVVANPDFLPTGDHVRKTQPPCCKKLADAGWVFNYDPETRFVGAYHPLGGMQSVVEVVRIGRSGFDAEQIGEYIALMLAGM